MKHFPLRPLGCLFGLLVTAHSPLLAQAPVLHAAHAAELKMTEAELRLKGAYGFPQAQAQMLCDTGDLRFSVWNNSEYFYAQAILWNDNDSALGTLRDGRAIGDNSHLTLDLDADGQMTKDLDRIYSLNPWPNFPGLRYAVAKGPNATTAIQSDSKGRGAIRYVVTPEGRKMRVDSFLIPLKEISRKVSDKIRLVYYGNSPQPDLTVNSVGFDPGHPYYNFNIPMAIYHDYFLVKGDALSVSSVPDGRSDAGPAGLPRH